MKYPQHNTKGLVKAYLFGAIVPLLCLHFCFRILRLQKAVAAGEFSGISPFLFLSDLAFIAGLFFLGFFLLEQARNRFTRYLAAFFMQSLILVILLIETASHKTYITLGNFIDFQIIKFSLLNLGNMTGVVKSEVDPVFLGILCTALALTLFAPWLIYFFLRNRHKHRADGPLRMLLLCTGIMFFFLASPAASLTERKGFARNTTLTVINSYFTSRNNFRDDNGQLRDDLLKSKLYRRKTDKTPKNVVVFVLESSRADALTPYSPERKTAPFLNKLSKNSLLARRAYNPNPHTSKALVSIFCGVEPRPSLAIKEAQEGGIPANCLASLLNKAGYDSVYFQSPTKWFEDRPGLVKNMGFQKAYYMENMDTEGFDRTNYLGYEDGAMMKHARGWLKRRIRKGNKKPFFAAYLTVISHHFWATPPGFPRKKYVEDYQFNKYLNTMRYNDNLVKELIETYKKLGLYKNTIFVFIADHGDGFYEHGHLAHSTHVYNEAIWIPLLIHDPSRFKRGKEIKYPVSQIDILPTLTYMLGFEVQQGDYPGYNILVPRSNRAIYSNCWYENMCLARIMDNKKYIHFFKDQPDEFYDLNSDPGEKKNIIETLSAAERDFWKNEALNYYNNLEVWYAKYADKTASEDETPEKKVTSLQK